MAILRRIEGIYLSSISNMGATKATLPRFRNESQVDLCTVQVIANDT
jgi:hypothetical protein